MATQISERLGQSAYYAMRSVTHQSRAFLTSPRALPEPNAALESIRTSYNLPGLIGARISTGPVPSVTAEAVGYRKQGNDTFLTTHDQFHLGSLTKAMTATLVALLISDPRNCLSWDSKIVDVLAHPNNVSVEHSNTTLAMLSSHFSGLSDVKLFEVGADVWDAIGTQTVSPVVGRQLVFNLALSNPPATTPGSNFSYSNVGYMILGHLIDTYAPGSCGSWETFIQQRLWDPLGMSSCGFGTPPEPTLQSIDNPWPHQQGDPDPIPVTPDRFSDNPPTIGPAGYVHCGADSYARFLAMHLDALLGRDTALLPAAAFETLHTPYVQRECSINGTVACFYTPGAWVVAGPDARLKGKYLLHDGTNTLNYAYGLLAPGIQQAFFSATNMGGDRAEFGANEVLLAFFDNALGF
ncbi:beta-lactamase/transpeptidase-like protein [Thozetella sp. PMI_491]|nr:beta-lactamase/transpeptidase-like protein [Thozetella sp. PMI_491]